MTNDKYPVLLAMMVAALEDLEDLHDKIDTLAAREPQRQGEVADAVVLQLAPKLDAAKRAARVSRRSSR